jgi:hypothetical protein
MPSDTSSRTDKLRILVSGMIAGVPDQGGAVWAVLQYLLGFRRLGHDVVFVEPCKPESAGPDGRLEDSASARYFHQVVQRFGLEDSSALLVAGTRETVGLPYERLATLAAGADLLVNISGMLVEPELTEPVPVRVYHDLDPAFAQLWHAQGIDMGFDRHTHFVTVGLAIGDPESRVPTGGRTWIPTLQPVVLEHWPRANGIEHDALTTVANWRGYGSVEHEGVHYGQKAHSLRPLIELPHRLPGDVLLALAIHPEEKPDLALLDDNGWHRVPATEVAGTPDQYAAFVRGSRAELGIAKSGYVLSRCAWFSDRSAVYLASGRPVIAQDTGFSRFLETGEGLFAFDTIDDVVTAAEELERDYERHSAAARAIAEEQFESDRVLRRLLERLSLA